jgi:hypothetical protein
MHTDYIIFDQALYDARIAMRAQAPRQQLSEVEAGCLDWHFGWPRTEPMSINFSMIYQHSVESAWVWACAVAHQLLPVTLQVDEEGSTAELCAQWQDEAGDVLCLTLRKRQGSRTESGGAEFARTSWLQGRAWFWVLLATALSVDKPNQAFGIAGEIRAPLVVGCAMPPCASARFWISVGNTGAGNARARSMVAKPNHRSTTDGAFSLSTGAAMASREKWVCWAHGSPMAGAGRFWKPR